MTDTPNVGTRPPAWPFVLSLLTIVVSVGLAVVARESPDVISVNTIGWLTGANLPVLFLVAYRRRDRILQARTDYTVTAYGNVRMVALALAGGLVGGYHGWHLALWLAS
ncbi:MAG: hypothetical protein ACREX8_12475 [Gammaproteobacteria bacterium]